MKKLIIAIFFLNFSNFLFADNRLGNCEYGSSGKNLYIKGGKYAESTNGDFYYGDFYYCTKNIMLGLIKLNYLFIEVGFFMQVNIRNNEFAGCQVRETYSKDEYGYWSLDSMLDFSARALFSETCNNF